MEIADALKTLKNLGKIEEDISITGHSLGGGLASAAYCASGFKTYTFNAAGLHKNSLYVNNNPTNNERYPGSVVRYNGATTSGQITAYYADHDLLGFIQDNSFSWLPSALGTRVKLISGNSLTMTLAALLALIPTVGTIAALGLTGTTMVKCHKMPAIYYGMLNSKGLY